MTLKDKFKKDYAEYLELCKKHNQEPYKEWQDFYVHKKFLENNESKNN